MRNLKPVKAGTSVKLKNSFTEFGTVVLVIGEGPTATYQIRTVDSYEWRFRDQFTIAR